MTIDSQEPIPAATLILMRSSDGGAPQYLMMERTAHMAFAAGALVFPGGRVDAEDHALGRQITPHLADAAVRVASIRETIEESGIAAAFLPSPDPEAAALIRHGLHEGVSFNDLLSRHGLSLDLEALVPFANWCPAFRDMRRFDTIFYLAEAPREMEPAEASEAEAVRILWVSAKQALAEADEGQAKLIFPTRRNLERLAEFSSFEEARENALRHPLRKITPWIEEREGEKWLCIPEDAGYPVTAEKLETARRF